MFRCRLLRTASFPLVTPARPRLGNSSTASLQARSAFEVSRPFTNPPTRDVVKTLRRIALAETLRTKGYNALSSESFGRLNFVTLFVPLFLDDLTKRYPRTPLHSAAQQSMEELHEILKADAHRAIPDMTAEERETLGRLFKKHGLILTRLVFVLEVMIPTIYAYWTYKVC